MTKKKKTLRAKVLASIFAMLICGCSNTVWAASTHTSSYDPDDYDISNQLHSAAKWDGAYEPTGSNPQYSEVKLIESEFAKFGSYDDTGNFIMAESLDTNGRYEITYNSGTIYGTVVKDTSGKNKLVVNFNTNTPDNGLTNVNGKTVNLPAAVSGSSDKAWNNLLQTYLQDFAATMAGFEAENRMEADEKLHKDDVANVQHSSVGNDGKFITTITMNDGGTLETEADISTYVNNEINNDAGNAKYNNSSITINQAITNNVGDIADIKNATIATEVNDHKWTVIKSLDNQNEVVTINDTTLSNKDSSGNAYDSLFVNDKGELTVTIYDTDGNSVVGSVDIGEAKITINKDSDSSVTDSITNLITNNHNEITAIENAYVTNITKNDNNSWTVTQNVTGKPSTVTITDTVTTVSTKEGGNLTLEETKDSDNNTIKYFVDIKDDVTFNSVTTSTLSVTDIANINIAKIGELEVVKANIGTAKIGSLLAENAQINEAKINSLEAITANIQTTNTEVVNLGTKEGGTDIRWDNSKGRITYGTEQIANLNDGLYYTGDVTTDEKPNTYAKLNKNVKIYGGATAFTEDDNIGVETTQDGDNVKMKVRLAKDIAGLNSVESNIVNVNNTLTVGDTTTNITITKDTININNKTNITENGININNKVVVEENKVDVGGNRIENVADGINPTDAVNVRQLNKLSGRVDKVGAGAAALAALHPLDFDPDDKLSFSAGVGNYGGETATALGMFYRPTEKVMLSAAGTMGNGENMVNMGVTFALDKTNNVSNSRVAMAREIQDLREQVAALTALVTQLAGRSNPALQDVVMFPDVPENHWAYDYIEGLQKRGIVEGYPDGNFAGDRSMTRYEYAAMLYRALEKGFPVDSRLLDEFDAELGRIRVDRIKGLDDDANKVERVRVNQYEDRDDYGSKLITVNAVKQ
ncbi:MAG: YadA-like family protein [Phascolarctobacterium sp.]|nr:YadA-like family protein [Phascolarctobacterium sp.]